MKLPSDYLAFGRVFRAPALQLLFVQASVGGRGAVEQRRGGAGFASVVEVRNDSDGSMVSRCVHRELGGARCENDARASGCAIFEGGSDRRRLKRRKRGKQKAETARFTPIQFPWPFAYHIHFPQVEVAINVMSPQGQRHYQWC